ncbi:hypothetical protein [Erysipelothrix larvae]|nr:hypothetical protein [Erysipelothrix larvae]
MKIETNSITLIIDKNNGSHYREIIQDLSDNKTLQKGKSHASILFLTIGIGFASLIHGNVNPGSLKLNDPKTTENYPLLNNSDTSVGGYDMSNNVSQETFNVYKDSNEKRLENIEKRLDSIVILLEKIDDKLITKESLETKLENTEIRLRNWILTTAFITVLGFLGWLFIYLFPNVDKLFKAIEAIK